MKDLVFLLIHLLTTLAKLLGPGGAKTAAPGNQPLAKTRTQSFNDRSFPAGILVAFPQSTPYPAVRDYYQAIDPYAYMTARIIRFLRPDAKTNGQ